MSEAKFTKGEWMVYGDWAIKRKGTTEILASFEERGFNNQEGFANAHLMAAAPEMYEAIKQCRKFYHKNGLEDLRDELDKLLAKARGE